MTLNLPLLYVLWLEEYCQISPNKNKSPNLWHVTSILVCCIFRTHCSTMFIQPKNTKNAFFTCFCPYVRQPHVHIGWAIPMPFASMNSTNPRTDPWNFHKKILRIGDFEKWPFFESAILNFIFSKKKRKKILHPNKN